MKDLNKNNPSEGASQLVLDLGIELQRDINGIEMGVLENGMVFLTQRGLASVCGQGHSRIYDITKEWKEHRNDEVLTKDRISFIKEYLFTNGFDEESLYVGCQQNGKTSYAYPEIVCMAILEYYAFEARGDKSVAQKNYRDLARFGLQKFIYEALGYAPDDKWQYYTDRVSILKNKTPAGYFTVFQEIGGMAVDLITAGLTINDKTIPDISVGLAWGKHWTGLDLDSEYGKRVQYKHEYPDYYPQSLSNPQPANAYPDEALSFFRQWFREVYLTKKFPNYILKKANILTGGKEEANRMIATFEEKTKKLQDNSLSSFDKSLKKR